MLFLTIKTLFLVAKLLIFFEISNFRKILCLNVLGAHRASQHPTSALFHRQCAFFFIPGAFHHKPTNQSVILKKQK